MKDIEQKLNNELQMRKEGENKAIKSLNKHKLSEEMLQKELQ